MYTDKFSADIFLLLFTILNIHVCTWNLKEWYIGIFRAPLYVFYISRPIIRISYVLQMLVISRFYFEMQSQGQCETRTTLSIMPVCVPPIIHVLQDSRYETIGHVDAHVEATMQFWRKNKKEKKKWKKQKKRSDIFSVYLK